MCIILMQLNACIFEENNKEDSTLPTTDTLIINDSIAHSDTIFKPDTSLTDKEPIAFDNSQQRIDVKNVKPGDLIAFAKTLMGVPYKYASTDPSQGFDCSGFITYVFNHFNIAVPRSSVDFTNIPVPVSESAAKPGDLILFTGTDSSIRIVGHMGIIIENGSMGIQFIHSSSGKANGVTVSPLEGYYRGRFVKLIRIF